MVRRWRGGNEGAAGTGNGDVDVDVESSARLVVVWLMKYGFDR